MYDQFCTAFIRQADADACVLHGTGDARPARVALIGILYCKECLFQCRGAVCDLSVWQYLTRLDGVAVADLPRGNSDFLCKQIDIGLQSELTLAHTKTTECSCRRIICIVSVSPNICVLVTVRSYGVSTRPLKDRSAQGCICTCVKINLAVQSGKDTVLVASKGECPLHGMTLRMEVDRFLSGKCHFHRPVHL